MKLLKSVGVTRAAALTPRANRLYKLARNLNQIRKRFFEEKKDAQHRLKEASKFLSTKEFLQSTVNEVTFNFIMSQIKLQKKTPKGRRFTMKDKIFALTIYKQGPKNYRLLEKIFALPSKYTLKKLLEKIPLKCGLNPCIMENLKKRVEKLHPLDRYCTLIFDEMSTSPQLQYNPKLDQIEGIFYLF